MAEVVAVVIKMIEVGDEGKGDKEGGDEDDNYGTTVTHFCY